MDKEVKAEDVSSDDLKPAVRSPDKIKLEKDKEKEKKESEKEDGELTDSDNDDNDENHDEVSPELAEIEKSLNQAKASEQRDFNPSSIVHLRKLF